MIRGRPVRATTELASDHRIRIRRRLTISTVIVLTAFAGLMLRLLQVQVLDGSRLQAIAARQQLASIALQPRRGRVLDRRGRALAFNIEATSIFAVPSATTDPRGFAATIAPVLAMTTTDVERQLASGRHFAWLLRKAKPEVVERVKALGLGNAVGFLREDRRAYPNRTLAAHVLGFVGIDNQGLAGVELSYDDVLRGVPGKAVAAHDGVGRVLIETQEIVQVPDDGADIILAVDQVIQHIAERELEKAINKTSARGGSIVVMDPRNGEVLAMAAYPAFDPNTATEAPPERWFNRPIGEVYEPGSTFKIFLSAAALDSGAVKPDDQFFCAGTLEVPGGHVIRDAHGRKHGWQTMGDVIKNSCNIGAAQIATRLGKARFYEYIRAFGFGERFGIDLPGEGTGIIPKPSAWLGPGLQTIAFGQGVSTTALQIVAAATAIAGDGATIRPHVLRAVRDGQGRMIKVVDRETIRQVVRPDVARAVRRMMIGAVESGTGSQARLDGYAVAGKTGTAQKPARDGGYDPIRFVASFLGLVPAEDPTVAILVILDEPRGVYLGGEVAAPVFREVAAQTLWYLRIPPQQSLTTIREPGNKGTGEP